MLTKDRVYRILFIGNSYTYYNDMPTGYFQRIAQISGYQVCVTAITKGRHSLGQFLDPTDPYGEKVAAALSVPNAYDYVVIQEQSVLPATDREAFYASVREMAARVRAAGAKPVLYATWGRKTGSDTLEQIKMTNTSMTWSVAAAYGKAGETLEIPVAHAGLAFYDVYQNSAIELYNPDLTHPSQTGSLLAAMTLFMRIFGGEPDKTALKECFASEETEILYEAARKAVFMTPALRDPA